MASPESGPLREIDLDALFAAEAAVVGPPAHDADFVLAVVRRAARRKLAFELAWAALVAALSALVLWAVGPVLAPAVKPLAGVAVLFAPIVLFAGAILVLVHPHTAPT